MNKDKSLFKNTTQLVVYLIIFFLLIGAFIYLGRQNYKKIQTDDHQKFNADFSLVGSNNVYEYANNSAVRMILNKGTGIVFFGTNKSIWADYYAKLLNEVALDSGIERIYYYDFINDRENKNGTYQSIVQKLSDYSVSDDLGNKNIYAPSLLIIKDNEIILFDDETSLMKGNISPKEYWSSIAVSNKKQVIKDAFMKYMGVEEIGE